MAGIYGQWAPNSSGTQSLHMSRMHAAMTHRRGQIHHISAIDGWQSGAVGPTGAATKFVLGRGSTVVLAGHILFRDHQLVSIPRRFGALERLLDEHPSKLSGWFEGVDGCFAFALVDPIRQKLLLANDRYGGVPIYLSLGSSAIYWASEVKAISGQIGGTIDPTAIRAFFEDGWLTPPRTYYGEITQLPSRSAFVSVGAIENGMTVEIYPRDEIPQRLSIPFAEAKERLKVLVSNAVRSRIAQRSSNDVVVTLSGGLDSRLLAAEARACGHLRAVTYGDPRSAEVTLAAEVARRLGIRHEIEGIDRHNWLTGRDLAVWMTDGMMDISHTHIVHVTRSIDGAGMVLDGLFGDVILGRGAIRIDPTLGEVDNRYLRMNRFTYFGPRIEQNFSPVATPFVDGALIRFMDGLATEITADGRLYREASGEMHPEVFQEVPWLKTNACPYPYRRLRASAAKVRLARRAAQVAGWLGMPLLGRPPTMDYFRWYRTKEFQRLYRELVDGPRAIIRDYVAVPQSHVLFSRVPNVTRLKQISRILTLEVWLRQSAAGRPLSWNEMLEGRVSR